MGGWVSKLFLRTLVLHDQEWLWPAGNSQKCGSLDYLTFLRIIHNEVYLCKVADTLSKHVHSFVLVVNMNNMTQKPCEQEHSQGPLGFGVIPSENPISLLQE